jgi:hypothetical protein
MPTSHAQSHENLESDLHGGGKRPFFEVPISVARSAAETKRQAKGKALNVAEVTSTDDLCRELDAALADAEGSLGNQ